MHRVRLGWEEAVRRAEVVWRKSTRVETIGVSASVVASIGRLTLIEIIVAPLLVPIPNVYG